jgi:hypothetical protein
MFSPFKKLNEVIKAYRPYWGGSEWFALAISSWHLYWSLNYFSQIERRGGIALMFAVLYLLLFFFQMGILVYFIRLRKKNAESFQQWQEEFNQRWKGKK